MMYLISDHHYLTKGAVFLLTPDLFKTAQFLVCREKFGSMHICPLRGPVGP